MNVAERKKVKKLLEVVGLCEVWDSRRDVKAYAKLTALRCHAAGMQQRGSHRFHRLAHRLVYRGMPSSSLLHQTDG